MTNSSSVYCCDILLRVEDCVNAKDVELTSIDVHALAIAAELAPGDIVCVA